ncbi:hypothetical protein [Sphingomonas azotifigens]|uniref:hypothetical protein n=1 Tax=Sphingomonas azotifigens TaxID=330920 RepID=UPI000A0122F0|nr:hypothetical protein [Sphingomonas azotifigens]
MAGKKEKKAKKDGKAPSLLPKVIGGIKLPKDARRQLTGLAKHPVIADLIAAGLVALAQRIKGGESTAEASPPPPPPAPAAEPKAEAVAEPAKPAVKRVRKTVAAAPAEETPPAKPVTRRARKPGAETADPAPAAEPAAAKPAKAPPPRRTRKAGETASKPRTRRTPPKTDS